MRSPRGQNTTCDSKLDVPQRFAVILRSAGVMRLGDFSANLPFSWSSRAPNPCHRAAAAGLNRSSAAGDGGGRAEARRVPRRGAGRLPAGTSGIDDAGLRLMKVQEYPRTLKAEGK